MPPKSGQVIRDLRAALGSAAGDAHTFAWLYEQERLPYGSRPAHTKEWAQCTVPTCMDRFRMSKEPTDG